MACSNKAKFIPGSDTDCEDIFTFPFITEKNTVEFIKSHGSIMFIVRGFPGTGKKSLVKLVMDQYPKASSFSATDYFSQTFSSLMRTRESQKQSHFHCYKNVLQACKKNVHPIIVHNTHVKKWELNEYLKYASQFNYTVIMISTTDKFIVTPELLEKSNTVGLNMEYFKPRIKQWQNIFPIFTGWFVSQYGSSYILNETQNILDVLKDEEAVYSILNGCKKDDFFNYYKVKKLLFCVAAYGKKKFLIDLKDYMLSENVMEKYGKCFEITIFAFVFTQSNVFALVHVDSTMEDLVFRPNEAENSEIGSLDIDKISSNLGRLSFAENEIDDQKLKDYSKTIPLSSIQKNSSTTVCFKTWEEMQDVKISNCSFIHVAESKEKEFFPYENYKLFKQAMDSLVNSNLSFCDNEQEKDYEINFEASSMCVVHLKKPFALNSVFTGLYA